MGIIIDIAIILFILASVFLGYKKGLISLGIQLVAFVIAIAITFVFYKPIGGLIINNTQIDEKLQQTIQTNIEEIVLQDINNEVTNSLVESARNGTLQETSKTLATNIIYGATILILYVVARICLIFVNALANTISKLPILNQFNKAGGVIYGLLRGIFITYLLLMIINLIISINPQSKLNKMLDQTYIAKTMITYNILNTFLN